MTRLTRLTAAGLVVGALLLGAVASGVAAGGAAVIDSDVSVAGTEWEVAREGGRPSRALAPLSSDVCFGTCR
jgi:hypothetical protein